MSNEAVAVLDIGKTNKKVSFYGKDYAVLASEKTNIDTYMKDEIEVENTEAILQWFRKQLREHTRDLDVKAIAVSAHGATIGVLNAQGELAYPIISYTADRGAEAQEEFYRVYGDRETLHRETCTADVGFCNMAKALYFMKTRLPDAWRRVRHGVFYNSYFGYELTGALGMEPTFVGNHSYLWDFANGTWSRAGLDLNAPHLFDYPLRAPWDALGRVKPIVAQQCGLAPQCPVTYGIHDSNANLLPYLAKGDDDFLLNSTGTWCVMMRPSETLTLSDADVRNKIFFNQDARGRPVRTALMSGGMDYDAFCALSAHSDENDGKAMEAVLTNRELFVVPGLWPDTAAFPGTPAQVIRGDRADTVAELQRDVDKPMSFLGQRYFAALNVGLALATARKIAACGVQKGTKVYIEGGFANNPAYCTVLAALCPDQRFFTTSMTEGTSFGAALTGWMCVNGWTLEKAGETFVIETVPIKPYEHPALKGYVEEFLARIEE